MKTIRVEAIPEGYAYVETSELQDYELQAIEDLGVEEARYWYGSGSYEGSGQLLMLKEGKWYHHDMGHCSCYGPTDKITLTQGHDTLEALMASCSDDLKKQLACLLQPNNALCVNEGKGKT